MKEYYVGGQWKADQGNKDIISFDIQQTHNELQGSATWPTSGAIITGTLNGSVKEGSFLATVNWANGVVSEYSGVFNISGRLIGINRDSAYQQTTWVSDKTFSRS